MFGSHLSVAGGLHKALLSAEALKHQTVQVFTANPRSFGPRGKTPGKPTRGKWVAPIDPTVMANWQEHHRRLAFATTVSHDSYLINLASADDLLWNKSIDAFSDELSRCDQLGIKCLVTHPGAHLGTGESVGLKRFAKGLDEVHRRVKTAAVITCLEITAGQGTSLGYKLEHLAEIIELVKAPDRVGVCLDTAHLFAAGYDFRGRRYARFRKQIETTVSIDKVKVLHLNDSKKPLGSRVDRHEHIGHGTIGLDGFRPIVRDKAFAGIPKILETPKEKAPDGRDWDTVNIEALTGLM